MMGYLSSVLGWFAIAGFFAGIYALLRYRQRGDRRYGNGSYHIPPSPPR